MDNGIALIDLTNPTVPKELFYHGRKTPLPSTFARLTTGVDGAETIAVLAASITIFYIAVLVVPAPSC